MCVGTTVPVFKSRRTKWTVTQHAGVKRSTCKILVGNPIITIIIIIIYVCINTLHKEDNDDNNNKVKAVVILKWTNGE